MYKYLKFSELVIKCRITVSGWSVIRGDKTRENGRHMAAHSLTKAC